MKHVQQGFTLIELMIVVAIIGILASIAIPSYNSYIDTANMSKVVSNYDEARRIIKNELSKEKSQKALGQTADGLADPTVLASTAADTAWITYLNNTTGSKSPGGLAAYNAVKEPLNGMIGIAGGSGNAIVVSMPGYGDLSAANSSVQ